MRHKNQHNGREKSSVRKKKKKGGGGGSNVSTEKKNKNKTISCQGRCMPQSLLMKISQLDVLVTGSVHSRYVTNNRGHCRSNARAAVLLKKM